MVKVSIIMPNKNNAKWLPKSIGSVLDQTYKNWELIVVDDHSTDRSIEVIREFMDKDSRVDCICNPDVSYPLTKNLGFEHSSGKYVVFLDSDDWLASEFLERGVENIGGVDGYVSSFRVIRPDGSIAGMKFRRGVENSIEGIKRRFWMENGNSLLRRKIINTYDIRFPELKYSEDVYFYVQYLAVSHDIYVDDFIGLTINRIGSELITSKSEEGLFETIKVFDLLKERLKTLRKDELIPLLENYSMPPSLLTYLDGLRWKQRFVYGFRLLPLLLKFKWWNYYARKWYLVTFIDLFIPLKWIFRLF